MSKAATSSYFSTYADQSDHERGLGISRSISDLKIVPRQNGSSKDRESPSRKSGKLSKIRITSSKAYDADRGPVSSEMYIPKESSRRPSAASISPTSSKVSLIGSRRFGRSKSKDSTNIPSASSSPTTPIHPVHQLGVIPPDLFAAPVSPVFLDGEVDTSATSAIEMVYHAESLSPVRSRKAIRATKSLAKIRQEAQESARSRESSRDGDLDSLSSQPRLHRSRSDPHASLLPYLQEQQAVSRSSTDPSISTQHTRSSTNNSQQSESSVGLLPTDDYTFPLQTVEASTGPALSIDDIIRIHQPASPGLSSFISINSPPVPSIPTHFRQSQETIPSIDEIVKQNAALLNVKPARAKGASAPSAYPPRAEAARSRTETVDSEASHCTRSSVDSVTVEVLESLKAQAASHLKVLHHSRSQPAIADTSRRRQRKESIDSETYSLPSSATSSSVRSVSTPHPGRAQQTRDDEVIRYLRSPRLTRLITLRRPPNHHLTVSLADVGDPDGYPVLVFLGLGCVRYLVALYDELAASLGLRLICIDRWGLGKTSDVPDSQRGFMEWASVVDETMDHLGIDKFSIIAHSAGAPYALASSIRLDKRIFGSIHLLAPWVNMAAEGAAGSYKWLKYVPSSVIRTAQTAEWKMQSWKLGKPPSIPMQGLGFDPRAPVGSDSTRSSPIYASFDESRDIESLSDPATPRASSHSPAPSVTSAPPLLPIPTPNTGKPAKKQSKGRFGNLFGGSPRPDSPGTAFNQDPNSSSSSSPALQKAPSRTSSLKRTPSAPSSSSPSLGEKRSRASDLDLASALMQASHAESLRGGTSDLLAILERTNRPAGFAYSDVEQPVKVWHGLKDEKISLNSVLSLENCMQRCKVQVVPGADHSLMTNVAVFMQVLQSIAQEHEEARRQSSHLN